ncbi:amidohydrolase [Haladaptatus sp. W1]|uniref:amidohydrolase family protein n=1 Tax=Haladaptatus sp. W1 TaxID=1897478 RepID=UPI000849DB7B|nr:amidohydrolase family protein [Haladaptatus sp. W1]ODR83387.1 amidohydrolase [Haladaptatus sp. W1]
MVRNTDDSRSETDQAEDNYLLIDCDVHNRWADDKVVTERLPEYYRVGDGYAGHQGIISPSFLYQNHGGFAQEEVRAEEEVPGSDLDRIREKHLDEYGIDFAVLTGNSMINLGAVPNRDYTVEVARAYNSWLIEECLPRDERFIGALLVPPRAPEAAAEIIEDMSDHSRVRAILLPGASEKPYGQPEYWPMYEAAEAQNLAVLVHPSSESHGATHPPTGAGYPNMYFEWHSVLGALYIGQLASLIAEGVFVEFPNLRVGFIEGGYGWVPHFMWRMDKDWKGLRSQVPWLEEPPSEYIRRNVWFSTQPMEEPETHEMHDQILEMMHADETLMFASDYPHWDSDSPEWGIPSLPEHMEDQIRYGNAKELFDLPDDPTTLQQ